MTGVEKNHGDKEFIKYLRKYLEAGSNSQMPLHSIYKKRIGLCISKFFNFRRKITIQ